MLSLFFKSLFIGFCIGLIIATVIFIISIPFYIYNELKTRATIKVYKELEKEQKEQEKQKMQEMEKLQQRVDAMLQQLGITREDLPVIQKIYNEFVDTAQKLHIKDPFLKDLLLKQLLSEHGYKYDNENKKFSYIKGGNK